MLKKPMLTPKEHALTKLKKTNQQQTQMKESLVRRENVIENVDGKENNRIVFHVMRCYIYINTKS